MLLYCSECTVRSTMYDIMMNKIGGGCHLTFFVPLYENNNSHSSFFVIFSSQQNQFVAQHAFFSKSRNFLILYKNYTLSYCLDDDDDDTVWTLIITIIIIISWQIIICHLQLIWMMNFTSFFCTDWEKSQNTLLVVVLVHKSISFLISVIVFFM